MKIQFNKDRMFRHRATFLGAWLAITIALVIFPGFELRGLAMGLIIGWWPLALFERVTGIANHVSPLIELLVMFLLSGALVGVCAWLVDAARLGKRVWAALLLAVIIGGAAACVLNRGRYEAWMNSPAVSAAIESKANYAPTRWEFYKSILIPKALAGSLWGLYAFAAGACLFSAAAIVRKRCPPHDELLLKTS